MSQIKIRASTWQKQTKPAFQLRSKSKHQLGQGAAQLVTLQLAYQRAQVNPHELHPVDLLALQRAVGNQWVQRMVAQHIDAPNRNQGRICSDAQAADPSATIQCHPASSRQLPVGVASAGIALQLKGNTGPGLCGGAWTCAASPCDQPDPGKAGNSATPTEWMLKIRIDTEAPTPADVGPRTFGHTYVEFNNSSGAVWTYGFYPNKATGTPDPMFKPVVGGCTVHPDIGHESCVDYTETFKLSKPEFDKALSFATSMCKAPPNYNIQTLNCTTFADLVAKQAGKSLPPIRGILGKTVPADNPNTLLEGLKDRDIPSRHAQSDTQIRNWVGAADPKVIVALLTAEKVRLINRLIDGWVAEGDIAGVERICNAVISAVEMKTIRDEVGGREKSLNKTQGLRFHTALNRI